MGVLSLVTTAKPLREKNGFSWFPIQEVAYLFAGIFMTIIPALAILKAGPAGALSDLTNAVHGPVRYFWATGILSSFLDNAPTYLTFLALAQGQGLTPEVVGVPHELLKAVSLGAVFMGANTYIGNGPNFMVRAIAEHRGVKMPSFVGYMMMSAMILLPIYALVTVVFLL